eukprot:302458_1
MASNHAAFLSALLFSVSLITDVSSSDSDIQYNISGCPVTLHIHQFDPYEMTISNSANVTINGIKGDNSGIYTSTPTSPVGYDQSVSKAFSLFWKDHYDEAECNCKITQQILDGCNIEIRNCWKIYWYWNEVSSGPPKICCYNTWVTAGVYTGTGYDNDYASWAENAAIRDLKQLYPSCFTHSPTNDPTASPTWDPSSKPSHDPTVNPSKSPTVYPTSYPSNSPSCQGCQLFDGTRCISGYRLYDINNKYCEPCPTGYAGQNGLCYPCKDDQEPTFDRVSCEYKPKDDQEPTWMEKIGWKIVTGVASAIGGVIVTCMLWCWKQKRCCFKEKYTKCCRKYAKQTENKEPLIVNEVNELVAIINCN